MNEDVGKRRKESWFDVAFGIEALGVTAEMVESALKKHIEKMSHVKNILVYETKFSDVKKVENPMKGVAVAHSQVVSVKFLAKDMDTLLKVIITYGPSMIEILGPDKKEINAYEVQNIANDLASLVHQFAAAGVGGIVITPDEKK